MQHQTKRSAISWFEQSKNELLFDELATFGCHREHCQHAECIHDELSQCILLFTAVCQQFCCKLLSYLQIVEFSFNFMQNKLWNCGWFLMSQIARISMGIVQFSPTSTSKEFYCQWNRKRILFVLFGVDSKNRTKYVHSFRFIENIENHKKIKKEQRRINFFLHWTHWILFVPPIYEFSNLCLT